MLQRIFLFVANYAFGQIFLTIIPIFADIAHFIVLLFQKA